MTTHILLLLCWGRREGWRNSLDGLGLIKERETDKKKKKKKKAHIVRLRALGWASYSRHLHFDKLPMTCTRFSNFQQTGG